MIAKTASFDSQRDDFLRTGARDTLLALTDNR